MFESFGASAESMTQIRRSTHSPGYYSKLWGGVTNPKGPSSPYFWFLVPIKAPKSLNNEYLDP